MSIRHYIDIINEASYDQMVKNMYANLPEQQAEIKNNVQWAKQVLKKDERVVWFLRILQAFLNKDPKLATLLGTYQLSNFENFKNELGHFFGINYDKIQNYQFQRKLVSDVFDELIALEDEFKRKQEVSKPVATQAGDYELFKFDNGYAWWFVNRAYCPEEGRSGAHCGNVTGKYRTDQRILSFRKDGNVLMTFILEPDGTLGEMKAKHNRKPPEEFHPHIVKLLTWDKIKGIGETGHQYRPDSNFNIFDLETKYVNYLYRAKPELVLTQIKATPIALLNADQSVQNLLWDRALKLAPELALAKENTLESWTKAIERNPKMIMYAPTNIPDYVYMLGRYARESYKTGVYLFNLPRKVSENRKIMEEVIKEDWHLISQVLPNNVLFTHLCKVAIDADKGALLQVEPDNISQGIVDYFFKKYPDDNYVGFNHIPTNLLPKGYFERVVNKRPHLLTDLKQRGLDTPEIYLAAVSSEQASETLDYIPKDRLTDEILKTALKHDARTVWYRQVENSDLTAMQIVKLIYNAPKFKLEWLNSDRFLKDKKDYKFYSFALDLGQPVKIPEDMYDQELAYKQAEIGVNTRDIPEEFIDQKVVDLALKSGSMYMFTAAPKDMLTPENVTDLVTEFAKKHKLEITSELISEFLDGLPEDIREKTRKLLTKDEHELAESVKLIKRLAGLLGK